MTAMGADSLLAVTLIVFMVSSLLGVGLNLNLKEAFAALRDVRFVVLTLLCAFALCPALAFILAQIIPLPEPYAIGLIFLGMAPCAPFFPRVAEKVGGDVSYVAAFVLLTAAGTVIFMPLATPYLVPGFKADAWAIARPLVFYIIAPLAIGVLVRSLAKTVADRVLPTVKNVAVIVTVIMLALVLWIYEPDFVRTVGSFAVATQLLFYAIVACCSYGLAFGLPRSQKKCSQSVYALAISGPPSSP
jgi:BASS family bile acid:Na+ symporter